MGAGVDRIFSHNLGPDERDKLAAWCRAVRRHWDGQELHRVGCNWFTALGHAPMWDHETRRVLTGRLEVIEMQQRRVERRTIGSAPA